MNNTGYIFIIIAAILSLAAGAFAQTSPPASPKVATRSQPPVYGPMGNFERSIEVAPSVSISMCAQRGDVRVNAWRRNEIRVLVDGGTNFGFKVMQKDQSSGVAEWVMIVRAPSQKENPGSINECLAGGDIEIDAPAGANLRVKGDNVTFNVDGLRKVSLSNAGGDLTIRNVSEGVLANTFRGDIFIESARGVITADSATGNIVVFETSPSEVGDTFRAKTTSGTISLEGIGHRSVESHSISGSVNFTGVLLPLADYYFTTETGALRFFLPETTSSRLQAAYRSGKFECDLPFKLETENISSGSIRQIGGTFGKGEATLRLSTGTGGIIIRKR